MLKGQDLLRIDLAVSSPLGIVTYTRFFQTGKRSVPEKSFIYLGSFDDYDSAKKFQEIVETKNYDILAERNFNIIEENKSDGFVYRLHIDNFGSSKDAKNACSILTARKFACLVIRK